MDIKSYSEKIINKIHEQPRYLSSELNINRTDFIELCAWVLKYYGGTASHEFLLKYNQLFLSLSIEELQDCVVLIKQDSHGLDSLVAFYFFFTNIHSPDFFNELSINKDIYQKYLGNNYQNNPFNKRMLVRLGLEQEEIKALNNLIIRKEKKVA